MEPERQASPKPRRTRVVRELARQLSKALCKRNAKPREETGPAAAADRSAAADAAQPLPFGVGGPPAQPCRAPLKTRAEIRQSADPQSSSLFFALPPEIRRAVYLCLWSSYLGPGLRVHIFSRQLRALAHTRCVAPLPLDPWPPQGSTCRPRQRLGTHLPEEGHWRAEEPPWDVYHKACKWGRHWRCAGAMLARMQAESAEEVLEEAQPTPEVPPFWGPWLTCRRMYLESSELLYGCVTPVLTTSEDAYRFLGGTANPWVDTLQSVELQFCRVCDAMDLFQDGGLRGIGPRRRQHGDWVKLVVCMRTTAPSLRDVRIVIDGSGRDEGSAQDVEKSLIELLGQLADGSPDLWPWDGEVIPRRSLVVDFMDQRRCYTKKDGQDFVQSRSESPL